MSLRLVLILAAAGVALFAAAFFIRVHIANDPEQRCADLVESAQTASDNGYHARTLTLVSRYMRDDYCQRLRAQRPLQLATTARMYVPELNGRERGLHLGLLSQLGPEKWSPENRRAWAQAMLVTGQYQKLLDMNIDSSANDMGFAFSQWTAAQALGDRIAAEKLQQRLTNTGTRPLLAAFVARQHAPEKSADNTPYAHFWRAMASGGDMSAHNVAFLANQLSTEDLETLFQAVFSARRYSLVHRMFAAVQPVKLTAHLVHLQTSAAWSGRNAQAAADAATAIDTGIAPTPETVLMLCDLANQLPRFKLPCTTLWDADDQAARIGRPYAQLWTAAFNGMNAGASALSDTLTALEKIDKYHRPSGPRYIIQARLYAAIGEPDLAIKAALKASRLHSHSQIAARPHAVLRKWQQKLQGDVRISAADIKAIRAESSQGGVLWRLLSARHLDQRQTEAAAAEAILILRDVLDALPTQHRSRAIPLLQLAGHYAQFRDLAATTDALDQAIAADPDAIALAYPLLLGFYNRIGHPFAPRTLSEMWHKIAWTEARLAQEAQPIRLVTKRLAALLRLAKESDDKTLVAASCAQLTKHIGPLKACLPET